MYVGKAAINQYVAREKGHLIIKKNELRFVKKVGFALRFKAAFGFGNAAERNVAAFINENREALFASNETKESFNARLEEYNKKRVVWWKKTKPIQDLKIQEVVKTIKEPSFHGVKDPSVHNEEEKSKDDPIVLPTPPKNTRPLSKHETAFPLPPPPLVLPPAPVPAVDMADILKGPSKRFKRPERPEEPLQPKPKPVIAPKPTPVDRNDPQPQAPVQPKSPKITDEQVCNIMAKNLPDVIHVPLKFQNVIDPILQAELERSDSEWV